MMERQTVKFGDICREVRLSSKDPLADGYDKYIGLEHLDSGSLKIKRWGSIAEDSPSFTRVFKKGHILFGKRRPYLKKAAIAEFDGICSGDIIVMEPTREVLNPGLLPFIVQSDKFWRWAIQTSSGSLSPRTKFKSLSDFQVTLNDNRNQDRLLEILNKAKKTELLRDKAQNAVDQIKRIFLFDLFGNISDEWITKSLGDLYDVQLGKMLSKKAKQGVNPKPYLANFNIQWGNINLDELNEMDFNEKEMEKFKLVKGDILVCEGGEIGRSAIWQEELPDCYYQKALHRLRPKNSSEILPEFMLLYMEYKFLVSNDFGSESLATTIAHIPRERLIKIPVSFPEIGKQKKIANAIANLSEVKESLSDKEKYIRAIQASLIA